MAKRRETLSDLIGAAAAPGETMTAWCKRVGVPVRTVHRLMSEDSAPRMGTVTLLAAALGVDAATVRAAITASRAAADR